MKEDESEKKPRCLDPKFWPEDLKRIQEAWYRRWHEDDA